MTGFYTCAGCRKSTPVSDANMEQWDESDKSYASVCSDCHYHMESLGVKYLRIYAEGRAHACD